MRAQSITLSPGKLDTHPLQSANKAIIRLNFRVGYVAVPDVEKRKCLKTYGGKITMKRLYVALAIACLSGCATQRFDIRSTNAAPARVETHSFWISGVGQSKTEDAAKVCGGASKVARVETEATAVDVLIAAVTLGIYTPREMRISCAS